MEENKKNINQENQVVDDKLEKQLEKNYKEFNPGEFYYPDPVVSKEETLKRANLARLSFYDFVTRTDKIKKIILIVFLVVMGGCSLAILINNELVNILFTPLLISFITTIIIIYILLAQYKKKRIFHFNQYKYNLCISIDSYCYYQTGISNLEFSYNTKIKLSEVSKIGCYENIIQTPSRDIVKGKLYGINFVSYDVLIRSGISIQDKASHKVHFSGKLFKLQLLPIKEGKMYIYLKGCGDSHPTELSGLEPVKIRDLKDEYLVFSSFENPSSMLPKKAIELLNRIKLDNVIEEVIISINENGVFVGYSLTSKYMAIPYKEEIEASFIDHYKEDIFFISNFASILSSNKNYNKLETNEFDIEMN